MSMLFGVTASVVSLFLRFRRRLLLKILKSVDGAKVQMPSLDEIEEFKQIVASRYTLYRAVAMPLQSLLVRGKVVSIRFSNVVTSWWVKLLPLPPPTPPLLRADC